MATTVEQRQGRYVGRGLRRREDERVLRGQAQLRRRHRDARDGAHRVRAQPARPCARRGDHASRDLPTGVLAVITAADLDGRVRRVPKRDARGHGGHRRPAPGAGRGRGPLRRVSPSPPSSPSRARWPRTGPRLVEVDYEPLDAVVDPRASEHALVRWSRSRGDVEGAFAGAAHVVVRALRDAAHQRRCRSSRAGRSPATTRAPGCSPCGPRRRTRTARSPSSRTSSAGPTTRSGSIVPDVGGALRHEGQPRARGRRARRRGDRPRAPGQVDRGPARELPDQPAGARDVGRRRARARRARGGCGAIRARIVADLGGWLWPATHIPPHTAGMLMTGAYDIPAADDRGRSARSRTRSRPARTAARGGPRRRTSSSSPSTTPRARSGIDPVALRRRNLVR